MSDQLDDLVRDALRAEVAEVQAPDDGLGRLHRHWQRRARRQRVARLVVAAAVAVAAMGSLALLRGGDDESPVIADEPTTTTAEMPTTSLPGADGVGVDPRDAAGPRPSQIVATTEDGRLVVLDVTTAHEVRELAHAGVASEYQDARSEPFIDAVEVSPDGSTVYYSTCCEPAPGSMYRVPLDGSEEPVRLALDGAYPDIRPGTGAQVAIANTIGVHVYDLPVGTLDDPTGSRGREVAEATGNAAQPFWLGPTSLAFQRFDPNEGSSIAVVLDIDTASPTVNDLPTQSRIGWEHPVGTDAAIIVAEQCCAPEYADTATGRIVDPSNGDLLDSFPLDGPVADLDLSNNWLLITYTDGELDAVDLSADPLTPEPLASDVNNAAWVPPAGTGGSTTTSSTATSTTSSSSTTERPTLALENVDWTRTKYPLDCGSVGWRVWSVAYAQPTTELDVALVLVTCDAGAGTPPVELYVFDRASSATTPHLADTLVTSADNWQANEVTGDAATVSLPVHGFSSADIPRCCPDIAATLTWVWNGNSYQPTDRGPAHYQP